MSLPTPSAGQVAALAYIRRHIADTGRSPTVEQVADGIDCALSTASTRIGRLIHAGWLTRDAAGGMIVAPVGTPSTCPHCGHTGGAA